MQRFNSYIIRSKDDTSFAICPKCNEDKPLSEYYVHSERKDGAVRYRPYCKKCRVVTQRKNKARPVHSKLLQDGVQTCSCCEVEKPLQDYYSSGCFNDGTKKYRTKCKSCVLANAKASHPEAYKRKSEKRSSNPKNFLSAILHHASSRKRHLGFNIDIYHLNDLYEKQEGLCAISGAEMTYLAGHGRKQTNISIDRINSSLGYIRGNVQLVCDAINVMKSNSTEEELYQWSLMIVENYHGKVQNSRMV